MTRTLLIYRDLFLAPSEAGFLRRQYLGFTRLSPLFLARHWAEGGKPPDLSAVRVSESSLGRLLFRETGRVEPALLARLAELDPIALHAQFGKGGALALPLARRLGRPLIVTFHGGDATKATHTRRRLLPSLYQRRLAELKDRAAAFVCVSGFVRDRLRDQGFPDEKLVVLPIGVELPPTPPTPPPGGLRPERLLFVGRFVEKKGADLALRALRLLAPQFPSLSLTLVGDGPLRPRLEALAQGLNVRFTGWQPPERVAAAMRRSLCLVVPSRTTAGGDAEGLPSVIPEAIAAGLPVVAAAHAGIPELIRDGRTGLLFPEGSAEGLAGALARLLREPELCADLPPQAFLALVRGYDARRQSARLEELILAAAGGAGLG